MRSIKEIYVIGIGPSSSHTMGPVNACKYVLEKYKHKDILSLRIVLYGSLSATGKGHLTDYIINKKLEGIDHTIEFNKNKHKRLPHPNTLEIFVKTKKKTYKERIISIGGGSIITDDNRGKLAKETYPHHNMNEILDYCDKHNISLIEYIRKYEDKDIDDYIISICAQMKKSIEAGLNNDGELPGELHLKRKAPEMYANWMKLSQKEKQENHQLLMSLAAIAASEENAAGGEVVCAPTCGSSGVIPGILAYLNLIGTPTQDIIEALEVGALIGIVCKQNGSISGAEAGCQAEIGVAGAIGAAALAAADHLSNRTVVQAAEIALEHSLGLTCDPVGGRVQIPCIERNAMYALKAKDAYLLAKLIPTEYSRISLDDAIKTMLQTGKDINPGYRETSKKGLAKLFK